MNLFQEFKKINFGIQLREGLAFRTCNINFYNGGLGSGTQYDVTADTTSLSVAALPVFLYRRKQKLLYKRRRRSDVCFV